MTLPERVGRTAIAEAGSPCPRCVGRKRTGTDARRLSSVPDSGWPMPLARDSPTTDPMTAYSPHWRAPGEEVFLSDLLAFVTKEVYSAY